MNINTVPLVPSDCSVVGKYKTGERTLFLCDTTDGAFTVLLPDANAVNDIEFIFKLRAGTGTVTVQAINGQTVN